MVKEEEKAAKKRKVEEERVAVVHSRSHQPPLRESLASKLRNAPNPRLEQNPLQGKPIAQFANGTSKANATKDPTVIIGIQNFAHFMRKAVVSLASLVVSFTNLMPPQLASSPQLKRKLKLR